MQPAYSRGRKKYQIKAIYGISVSRYVHVYSTTVCSFPPPTERVFRGGEL